MGYKVHFLSNINKQSILLEIIDGNYSLEKQLNFLDNFFLTQNFLD
jgi:hypothetical protein